MPVKVDTHSDNSHHSETDYILTEENYSHFKMCCARWIRLLNLNDWDIYYIFKLKEGLKAQVVTNYCGLKATIILSTNWNDICLPTEAELDKTALHECLHILMNKLSTMAKDRTFSEIDYEMMEHEAINRLIKVILFRQAKTISSSSRMK